VHKPYARIYALLAREARFDSALIVRGVEGGVVPSLRQAGKAFYYHDGGEEQPFEFSPADFGVDQSLRAPQIPGGLAKGEGEGEGDDVPEDLDTAAVARFAAEAGMDALRGRPGPTRDGLICSAALCLHCLKRYDSLKSAANAVREVLDTGKALRRLQRAR
jgi:anthranilate phosphoribosyltransferase